MLLYRLTFTAGAKKVKFYTIKNFEIGAHITSVVKRNFSNKENDSLTIIIKDEKSGKLIYDNDIIGDGCTYKIIIRRGHRQSSSVTAPSKSKRNKNYWIR